MNLSEDEALPRTEWLQIIAAALLLTALNAVKPVHIDDSVYIRYAYEFAAHPLDPYAFAYGTPTIGSANHLLVPPVFPYWLALGTRVVGDSIPLLKCWLFPIALILAWAIDFLSARFAPSLRRPVFLAGTLLAEHRAEF